MNQEKRTAQSLLRRIGLLYEEADKSQIKDLEGIEKTVRSQILEVVSLEIALFLSKKQAEGK